MGEKNKFFSNGAEYERVKDNVIETLYKNIKNGTNLSDEDASNLSGIISAVNKEGLKNLNVYTNTSKIIKAKYFNGKNKPIYTQPNNENVVLNILNRKGYFDIFEELSNNLEEVNSSTRDKETPNQLMARVRKLNDKDHIRFTSSKVRSTTSLDSALLAYERFKERIEKVKNNESVLMVYDTETLGGKNISGNTVIDAITEFTGKVYSKDSSGKLIESPEKSFTNIMGINRNKGLELIKEIKEAQKNGAKDYRMADVIIPRASKYANANFIPSINPKTGKIDATGLYWQVENFGSPENTVDTYDNAIKGINNLMNLYDEQFFASEKLGYKNSKGETILYQHRQLSDMILNMAKNKDLTVLSQNGIKFDTPILNQYIASEGFTDKEYLLKGLEINNKIPYYFIPSNRNLDLLSITKFISDLKGGKNRYYRELNNMEVLNKYSQFKQEAISNLLFGESDNVAHISSNDVDVLFNIVNQPITKNGEILLDGANKPISFLDLVVGDINKELKIAGNNLTNYNPYNISGKYTGPYKQLFMMNSSFGENNFQGISPLNFVIDDYTKTIRTSSGYEIANKGLKAGNIEKEMKQWGLKKNIPFAMSLYEFDTTEEYINTVKEAYPNKAIGKNYAIIAKPVYNKKTLPIDKNFGLDSSYVYTFNSKEDVESFLSNLIHIGDLDKNVKEITKDIFKNGQKYYSLPEKNESKDEIIKALTPYINGKPKKINEKDVLEYTINNNPRQIINDTASRKVRDYNPQYIQKVLNYIDSFKKIKTEEGKALTPDELISQAVASGVSLDLKTQNDIKKMLGFMNRSTKERKIYRETIDNTMTAIPFIQSQSELFKLINNKIKSLINLGSISIYGFNNDKDTNPFSNPNYAEIYKNSYIAARNEIANQVSMLTGKDKELLLHNVTEGLTEQGKDLNYVQLDLTDMFNQKFNRVIDRINGDNEDKIISLSLDPNSEFNLLKEIFNLRYTSMNADKSNAQGISVLKEFIDTLKSQKDEKGNLKYAGIFKDLKADFKTSDAETIAEDIRVSMIKYFNTHKDKRFIKNKYGQNVASEDMLLTLFKEQNEKGKIDLNAIDKTIEKVATATPQIKVIKSVKEDFSNDINRIVNEIMMPIQSKDFNTYKSMYGEEGLKSIKLKQKMDKQEAIDYVTNLATAVLNTGGQIRYDTKNKLFSVIYDQDKETLISLPKFELNNGMYLLKNGELTFNPINYLNFSAVGRKGYFDPNDIKIAGPLKTSTLKDNIMLEHSILKAQRKGASPATAIVSYVQNINKHLAENPAFGKFSKYDFTAPFNVDYKSFASVIKNLVNSNYFSNILDEEDITGFYKAFSNILTDKPVGDLPKEFEELSITQRSFINKYITKIFRNMGQDITGNSNQKKLLKRVFRDFNLSPNEKIVSEGVGAFINVVSSENAQFSNPSRPVETATMKSIYRQRKAVKETLKDVYGIEMNTVIGTEKTFAMNNISLSDKEMINEVGVKYLNISDTEFRNIVSSDITKKKIIERLKNDTDIAENQIEKSAQAIQNALYEINLHEDGSFGDYRLAEAFMKDTYLQRIKMTKNLMTDSSYKGIHKEQIDTLVNTTFKLTKNDDGTVSFKYGEGKKFKKGQTMLYVNSKAINTENTKALTAAYDGRLNLALYTKEDIKLSEEELTSIANKYIQKNRLDADSFLHDKKALNGFYEYLHKNLNLTPTFVLDKPYGPSYIKTTLDNEEKTMTDFYKPKIGYLDPKIEELIDRIKEDYNININKNELIGLNLSEDELYKRLYKKIDTKITLNKLAVNDAKTLKEMRLQLQEKIKREQNILADIVFGKFEKNINPTDSLFGGARLIVNMSRVKHGDIGSTVNNVIKLAYYNAETLFEKKKVLEDAKVLFTEKVREQIKIDGFKLVLPNSYAPGEFVYNLGENYENIDKFLNDYNLSFNYKEKKMTGIPFKDTEGNIVGTFMYGNVLTTENEEGGTSLGTKAGQRTLFNEKQELYSDIERNRKQISENKNKIKALNYQFNLIKNDSSKESEAGKILTEKKNLIKQNKKIKNNIENLLSANEARKLNLEGAAQREKGFKYSDRTANLLNATKINDEFLATYKGHYTRIYDYRKNVLKEEKLQNVDINLLAEKQLEKDLGFALEKKDGKLVIKDVYKNKSLLAPQTNYIKNELMVKGYDDLTVQNIDDILKNKLDTKKNLKRIKENYSEVLSVVNNLEDEDLRKKYLGYSANYVKNLIETSNGINAVKYMDQTLDDKTSEKLFSTVHDIKKIMFDIEGNAHAILDRNSMPIGKNMLVDLGEEFEDKRYLAVPNMGVKVYADTTIKTSHIETLQTIQNKIRDYNIIGKPGYPGGEEAKSRKKQEILKYVDAYTENLKTAVGSKEGKFSENNYLRLQNSYRGEATNIPLNLPKEIKNYKDGLWQFDKEVNKQALLKEFNRLNPNLSNIKIKGKSFIEHALEGKIYDVALTTEEAFRDMGYFDKEYLDNVFRDRKSYKNIDLSKISKEDAMREILMTEGTIGLSSRFPEIMEGSTKTTRMYLKADVNGDGKLSPVKEGKKIWLLEASGLSTGQDNDSDKIHLAPTNYYNNGEMMDEIYYNLQSERQQLPKLKTMLQANYAMADFRAIGINPLLHQAEVYKKKTEAIDRAIKGSDVLSVATNRVINGKIFAEATTGVKNYTNYEKQISILSNIKNELNKTTPLDKTKTEEYIDRISNYIKSNISDKEQDKYYQALALEQAVEREEISKRAKTLKKAIGSVNRPAFKARQYTEFLVQSGIDKPTERSSTLQAMMNIGEQDVISVKHLQSIQDLFKVENLSGSISGIFSANGKKKLNEHVNELKRIFNENFRGSILNQAIPETSAKSISFANAVKNMNDEEKVNYLIDSGIDTLKKIHEHGLYSKFKDYMDLGDNLTGPSNMNRALTYLEGSDALRTKQLEMMKELGLAKVSSIKAEELTAINFDSKNLELVTSKEWLKGETTSAREGMEGILKGINETFRNSKNFDKGSLALGALGIAASFLVSGFVGGNPSQPAGTEAQNQSYDDSDFYTLPELQDQNNIQKRKQNGYIINIKGQTHKSKNDTVNTIHRTTRSSIPQDVNISMNINDNTGNINDRTIQNWMAGALD